MNSNTIRFEPLGKDNHDTWKMQMEAMLIQRNAWGYVNGSLLKPEVADDAESRKALEQWVEGDSKAKSELILCICPSELKQVKGCLTAREVWFKLESIYQSRGPARKATLLKQLMLQKMQDGGDVRGHIRTFFDAVDKLGDMEIEINQDLLAIMLLYSLPESFENFGCAIESRDELPSPESLKIKIIEENDARTANGREGMPHAMFVNRNARHSKGTERRENEPETSTKTNSDSKIRCYRCRKIGHRAINCKSNTDSEAGHNITTFANEALFGANADSGGKWCLDSGCSSHLCKVLSIFEDVTPVKETEIKLASDLTTTVNAKGTVSLFAKSNGYTNRFLLMNTLHVPDLRMNLMSVGKLTGHNLRVAFKKELAEVSDVKGRVVLVADRVGDLYFVRGEARPPETACIGDANQIKMGTWHRRLGHLNMKSLSEGIKNGSFQGVVVPDCKIDKVCEICIRGKMTREPFPKKSTRETKRLELIHSDVCGPMRTESYGRSLYFVTFIDDATRLCWIKFMRSKSEVFQNFKEFKEFVERQTGRKIKQLQTDNGTEYKNREFESYLRQHGIHHRLTVAYNPEQNGVAERKNRTLVETARCLLLQSGLSMQFWAEAVKTANYIRNRCPSRSLEGKTPFEKYFGTRPNVKHFREFGCDAYMLDRRPGKGKFEPRTKKCTFVGYIEESKAYKVWFPDERKFEVTSDVKFLEGVKVPSNDASEHFLPDNDPDVDVEIIAEPLRSHETEARTKEEPGEEAITSDEDEVDLQEEEHQEVLRKGPGRPCIIRTGLRGRPKWQYNTADLALDEYVLSAEVQIGPAMESPAAEEWIQAMATEMRSILKNDTWELVERPASGRVIGSRMVLRNKYGADGELEKRKARIVARGFSQRPGIDFNETFSPVARLGSIRLITALAARHGMRIHQFDVTAAYLNGTLEEDILMEVPDMFEEVLMAIQRTEPRDSDIYVKAKRMLSEFRKGNKVCHLKKALYGLRQAGRRWYTTLDAELRKLGATPLNADPCVYVSGQGEEMTMIAVYVDDFLVVSKNTRNIDVIKARLKRRFEIKDLGEVSYCLGIHFNRSRDGRVSMDQRKYIQDILERFGMSECKSVSTPMDVNARLAARGNESETEDGECLPYRSLIGSLMYLATATRPDIAYAVSFLSQFNDCHGREHWNAAKRVLRYLKGTMDYGLVYGTAKSLKGYVDADWGNSTEDRRSYTGYSFCLHGAAVTWEARKQRTVALSSTEAEYMGLADSGKEAIYLQSFLEEIGLGNGRKIEILCDNQGAFTIVEQNILISATISSET